MTDILRPVNLFSCCVVVEKNEGFFLGREFCAMVQKIFIYTREEVQKMNPGNALSFSDDKSTPSEDSDLAVDPSA